MPTPQYTPVPQYSSSALPPNYQNQMAGQFLPPNQQFPGMMNNGGMPQYNPAPQVGQQFALAL